MTHVERGAGRPTAISEDVFRDLLKEQFPRYVGYAKSLTRDADKAMDAVQNAMVGVLRGSSRPLAADKVHRFMQTAIRHAVYDATDAKKRQCAKVERLAKEPSEQIVEREYRPLMSAADDGHRWCQILANPNDRELLRRYFPQLNECQRSIVELVLFDRLSMNAASKILGLSNWAVDGYISRAVVAVKRFDAGIEQPATVLKAKQADNLKIVQAVLDAGVASTEYQRKVLLAVVHHGRRHKDGGTSGRR